MASLTKYTIEIHAETPDDAVLALEQVSQAIAGGYQSAPWNPAGDDGPGNGYQFNTEQIEGLPQAGKDGAA